MKYIKLFEAVTRQTPNEVLKDFKLSTKELDSIIEILSKYKIDNVLLRELIETQKKGYSDLRKWKAESFIDRYEKVRPKIEELMEVQDYFLELSDMGYGIIISSSIQEVSVKVSKSRDVISGLEAVFNHLKHLNARKRLPVKLTCIEDEDDEYVVTCSYDSPTLVDRWY